MFVLQATSGNVIEDISATLQTLMFASCLRLGWLGERLGAAHHFFFFFFNKQSDEALCNLRSDLGCSCCHKLKFSRHRESCQSDKQNVTADVSQTDISPQPSALFLSVTQHQPGWLEFSWWDCATDLHSTSTPWSPTIQTAQILFWQQDFHDAVKQQKATLFNPVCVSLIYYGFIGKYVFSHANQIFSSKNMKKGVCKDTRMAKKCTFYKRHKKSHMNAWMSQYR